MLNPTTYSGKFLQSLLNFISVLGFAFPLGVISNELDRASRRHFDRLVKLAQIKEEQFLAEARRTANTGFALSPLKDGVNSMKNDATTAAAGATGGASQVAESFLGTMLSSSSSSASYASLYNRAMKFKKAAKRFQAGEFPLFPPGDWGGLLFVDPIVNKGTMLTCCGSAACLLHAFVHRFACGSLFLCF